MDIGNKYGHLSYSTLVHPGDTWEQMRESLHKYLPQVKKRVSPHAPFGVSIRLSAATAAELVENREERDDIKRFFKENDLYVYTANAFVYGSFKNTLVKEQVYEPDWHSEERLQYTKNVADILADISPAGVAPSIQTAPLAFRPKVNSPEYLATMTRNVLRMIAHLADLESRTGRRVTLAIEPEPACYLETTDDVVTYFRDHVHTGAAARQLAEIGGMPVSEAIGSLRRYVGIVYDICHQAVECEDIEASLNRLVDAGIPIFKLQEASAVRVPEVTQANVDLLKKFADTIYLTQTTEQKDGKIRQYLNLEEAFDAWERDPGPREWRIHFHVPVFLDALGSLGTTRFAIEEALRVHKALPLSTHLEIETYTWDVLPDHLKTGDIVDYVSRELDWVRGQLID
ncbi:metabolite traffic protein EboE [Paraburkholderia phytofirmans]|uniref:metabolite traffic protein EboE n=1 Tax=Paraburkholderia sp. BL9I2N2 TaxID=1938809 RepID=UPI0010EC29B7|nr:metabolite traffic protein EboE [Paraburkholderia sp. BL9I2N2]TCK88661.1 xylose isomerase-like TIM barrel protein [Paraburkholderia sp. BL9I2N2]